MRLLIRGNCLVFLLHRVSLLSLIFFFADDSLLFGSVDMGECEELSHVIQRYSLASGQRINFDKFNIYFSSNTNENVHREFC